MRIYANLLGTWTDVTESGMLETCDPITFIKEGLTYSANSLVAECFKYDYVNVQYDGKNYRIHPSMIQIVT